MFQAHVSSVSSVFQTMLQIFHLDVLKVDLREHMCLSLLLVAPPWVTVWAPEADKRLRSTHSQAG
jgi:hypothetical protein